MEGINDPGVFYFQQFALHCELAQVHRCWQEGSPPHPAKHEE